MGAGLFDEYGIGVTPLLLGSCTPPFQEGGGRLNLALTSVQEMKSGVAVLTYVPGGE